MYFGESQTSVDDKGRIAVPMHFRAIMEVHDHDVWYMTRGFDGAVFLFHRDKWNELSKPVEGFASLDPEMLDFRRLFIGSVAKAKRDRQGRLAIPTHLREYAGIDREAVLIGVDDHLELWSRAGWRAFQERQAEQYKAMAARLFGKPASRAAETQGDVQGD